MCLQSEHSKRRISLYVMLANVPLAKASLVAMPGQERGVEGGENKESCRSIACQYAWFVGGHRSEVYEKKKVRSENLSAKFCEFRAGSLSTSFYSLL